MLGVGSRGPLGPTRTVESILHAARSGSAEPCRLAEERQAWVVLTTVEGVGDRTLAGLIATHGSARRALWLASRGRLGRGLVPAVDQRRGVIPAPTLAGIESAARDPGQRLASLVAARVWTVTLLDPDYPRRLLSLLAPPPVLFGQGEVRALGGARAVAIVGTRRASPAGRFEASRAAAGLASRGVTVVSGLAVGIDGAAHAAALESSGTTVAAIGSGHARPGPAAHRWLVRRILERGALVGELPPAARATRGTYPRRNRLIVALADAVLVVEAPSRSGALITAHLAMEQSVPLYVAPGRERSPLSAGCRDLLDDGSARTFTGVETLCADLGWDLPAGEASDLRLTVPDGPAADPLAEPAAALTRPPAGELPGEPPPPRSAVLAVPGDRAASPGVLPSLGAPEREVARVLSHGPVTMDELLGATRAAPGELAATLTLLQLRGLARVMGPLYLPAGPLLTWVP